MFTQNGIPTEKFEVRSFAIVEFFPCPLTPPRGEGGKAAADVGNPSLAGILILYPGVPHAFPFGRLEPVAH